jgi:hypothetical protein
MNKRIQQLYDAALVSAGKDRQFETTNLDVVTKFAELIVNECIDQVAGTKIVGQFSGDEIVGLSESADKKYAQWNNALAIATMNVRDHFGVEE